MTVAELIKTLRMGPLEATVCMGDSSEVDEIHRVNLRSAREVKHTGCRRRYKLDVNGNTVVIFLTTK